MIAWLQGALRLRDEDGRVVIDVGGVGYAVQVPVGVLGQAHLGETVELLIHTQVREDLIALYGFEDEGQLQAFNALLGVSKVGPKLALGVLSGLAPADLAAAVDAGDVARLATVSGVGKRLAERLAVELRGKIAAAGASRASASAPRGAEPVALRDLRSALSNLQYRPKEVDAVIAQIRDEAAQEGAGLEFDAMLRRALVLLKR